MKNKDFMDRWYTELWNNGNESVMDEMLHPEVKAYGLRPDQQPLVGIDAFKEFYKAFRDTLDDIHITIDKNILVEDLVISLCSVTAIDRKSKKPISITGTSIGQLKDGLLINGWNHFDFLSLNLQLGKITIEQLA